MIGEYARVTPEVMLRAIADPKWARAYIDELEGALGSAQERLFSTYKAWNILAYLLERAQCPVDVIYGEQEFAADDDWGYGPPRLLAPDRVQVAAEVLRGYRFDELSAGVTDADLYAAEVYPMPDPSPDNEEVMWAGEWFGGLVDFFEAAARDGDAVIVWID